MITGNALNTSPDPPLGKRPEGTVYAHAHDDRVAGVYVSFQFTRILYIDLPPIYDPVKFGLGTDGA
jgi:hypothetical protein